MKQSILLIAFAFSLLHCICSFRHSGGAYRINQCVRSSELQGKKISDEEWNKIKDAIEKNPDEWKSALVSKRSEWATLKSSGALDGIDGAAIDEDDVAQIDQVRLEIKAKGKEGIEKLPLLRNRLLRSARGKSDKSTDTSVITNKAEAEAESGLDSDEKEESVDEDDDLVLERLDDILDSYNEDDENSDDELVSIMSSDRKTFALLRAKYASLFVGSNVTAVGLYGFLNEVKDKKVYDTEFIENIVFTFSRLKVEKTAVSAFKIYYKLWQDKLLSPQPETMRFGIDYANTCFVNNLPGAGEELRSMLLADGLATTTDFFIGELCASIHTSARASDRESSGSGGGKHSTSNIKKGAAPAQDTAGPAKTPELVERLQQLHTDLKKYAVPEVRHHTILLHLQISLIVDPCTFDYFYKFQFYSLCFNFKYRSIP